MKSKEGYDLSTMSGVMDWAGDQLGHHIADAQFIAECVRLRAAFEKAERRQVPDTYFEAFTLNWLDDAMKGDAK